MMAVTQDCPFPPNNSTEHKKKNQDNRLKHNKHPNTDKKLNSKKAELTYIHYILQWLHVISFRINHLLKDVHQFSKMKHKKGLT